VVPLDLMKSTNKKFKLSRYQEENLVFDKYIVYIALNLMTDELEKRRKAKRELAKRLSSKDYKILTLMI
jgi:hypothetical protein